MAIIIIPSDKDPRQHPQLLQPINKSINHGEEEFPPLMSTISIKTIRPAPKPGMARKWNDVVREVVPTAVTFDLMRLPLELREKVYEEVMRNEQVLDKIMWLTRYTNNNTIFPSFLPMVCFASKGVLEEATPVYIRNTEFVVNSITTNRFLTAFLESVPNRYDGVKRLSFPWFDCFPGMDEEDIDRNLDLELMARCGALNFVDITFHFKRLRRCGGYDEVLPEPKSVPELVTYYNFEQIFDSKNLRKITWDGIWSYWAENNTNGSLRDSLVELAKWVETEFLLRNNQKIHTEVTWR